MAERAGKVLITCKNGKTAYMNDVLYVPIMKNNLLSLGQLMEKGYTMFMQQNYIEVFDNNHRSVLKAPLSRNRTFKVNLNANVVQCLSTINIEEEGWLWHYRFGHLNFKSLGQLNTKEMVKGVPLISIPDKTCVGCVIGKQTIKEFKKSAPKRAKQPLDVIYSDVCGPFDVLSL
ncbi:hypothetical protein V8G54_021844 [Vigna mungo]|uniref:GAG-pre-integrase domain-containing protein n=1 Tax=Vigna mungo TaxID=3915 RepID=A0AAQ3NI44_VIGMU